MQDNRSKLHKVHPNESCISDINWVAEHIKSCKVLHNYLDREDTLHQRVLLVTLPGSEILELPYPYYTIYGCYPEGWCSIEDNFGEAYSSIPEISIAEGIKAVETPRVPEE